MLKKLFSTKKAEEPRLKDFLDVEFKEQLIRPKHVNLFSYFGITLPSRVN